MNKKIAMVIAFRDFRDEEYFIPKKAFEANGAKVITFSDSLGKAIGSLGGEAEVSSLLENFDIRDFDAVLFVGGSGVYKYVENDDCHRIVKQAVENNKILGAICAGPIILAKAGALKQRKATVWSSSMDKSAVKILEKAGAIYQKTGVVIDGKIITASGPIAAKEFSQAVISLLQ